MKDIIIQSTLLMPKFEVQIFYAGNNTIVRLNDTEMWCGTSEIADVIKGLIEKTIDQVIEAIETENSPET